MTVGVWRLGDRPLLPVQNLQLPCQITLLPNNQFLGAEPEFKELESSSKRLLMPDF
jgi:deoxyribodipyrimidine photolyase-related protein